MREDCGGTPEDGHLGRQPSGRSGSSASKGRGDKRGNCNERMGVRKGAAYLTGIPSGIYTIKETQAPEGYVPMEDMKIEILPNQTMQHFDIKNQPIQIEIGKVSGETGKLLGGAVLQLVRDSDGTVIRKWTSRDGEAEHFKNLAGGTYI